MSSIIDALCRFDSISKLNISNINNEEKKMLFTYLKHVDEINGEVHEESKRKKLVTTYSPLKRYYI